MSIVTTEKERRRLLKAGRKLRLQLKQLLTIINVRQRVGFTARGGADDQPVGCRVRDAAGWAVAALSPAGGVTPLVIFNAEFVGSVRTAKLRGDQQHDSDHRRHGDHSADQRRALI